MNNKIKKLISGVLAVSIGVFGNGVVSFAEDKPISQNENAGFEPKELSFSGKTVHKTMNLEKTVEYLNKFTKIYNSITDRGAKRIFARWELKDCKESRRQKMFNKEGICGELVVRYILCCLDENPCLASAMEEMAEFQKEYDKKATEDEKIAFATGKRHANCLEMDEWEREIEQLDDEQKDEMYKVYWPILRNRKQLLQLKDLFFVNFGASIRNRQKRQHRHLNSKKFSRGRS